ncbi:MAG: TetR/AcrR family transcriptional regulator [Ilumatobacter sp.]
MAKPSGRPIRDEVIDAACTKVQQIGVNSLSFGVLAKELGISAPSIHHHFRTKDDLIGAVAARYRAQFGDFVDTIIQDSAADRLMAYAALFDDTTRADLMCFCGSVASDWLTTGEPARQEVGAFFEDQQRWLRAQLERGVERDEFAPIPDAAITARLFLAALEGAMLITRAGDERSRPGLLAGELVSSLRRRID